MSAELHADDEAVRAVLEADPGSGPPARTRPNVSGDLPTVFAASPMFRRAVIGYDRFQVDTYVQWAEEELATADRERENLLTRILRTQTDLDEAQRLLAHSPSGGEFLQLSRRLGSMLAAAADEAESMRTDAEADRARAAAQAAQTVAEAERVLADAAVEAERMVAEATVQVTGMATEAARLVDEAEQIRTAARIEAESSLAAVRVTERRAAEHAGQVRRQAAADAAAALLGARDEVVRMLSTGRDERRRADAAAADVRERRDRAAAARYAALVTEVATLEHRRSALRADIERMTQPIADATGRRLDLHLRRLSDLVRWRPRSLRTH